jgi:hypothetical protein
MENHFLPNKHDATWNDLDDTLLVPTGKTARQLGPQIDLTREPKVLTPAQALSLGSGASTIENRNQVAMFKCDKCRGSGRWSPSLTSSFSGPCRKCKGTGKLKTDPETRARRKQAALKKAEAERGAYITAHIAEYTWATVNMARFGFAASMIEAVKKRGSWTDGQLTAIRKCMARDEERAKEREAQAQAAPKLAGAGFERMLAAFASAKAAGLKYPKLHIGEFTFSLAGAQSKYAGNSLFIKHVEHGYLGRIDLATAKFLQSRDCSPDQERAIGVVCSDPLAAAVLHGKQTGHCSCCGRELENPESVRLGIGPICREKWGLS